VTHDDWLIIQGIVIGGLTIGGWAYARGVRNINEKHKTAINLAIKDYKEATRLIMSLRNRLMAARWLKRRQALKTKKLAKGTEK